MDFKKILILFCTFLYSIICSAQKGEYLVGILEQSPNPCLKWPCKPSMIFSLWSNDSIFILCHQGFWFWDDPENFSYNKNIAKGDSIEVYGKRLYKKDLSGKQFIEFEIDTIYKILTTNSAPLNNNSSVPIFPNPFSERLNINLDMYDNPLNIGIINGGGKCKYYSNVVGNKAISVSTEDLIPGIYFCVIRTMNNVYIQKIIKH